MFFAIGERLTHHWLAGRQQKGQQRHLATWVTILNNKPARIVVLVGSSNLTPDALDWCQEVVHSVRQTLAKSTSTVSEALKEAFTEANGLLWQSGSRRADEAGLTLLIAVIQSGYLYLAHLGDNRAYLYRNRDLYQLTTNHTKAEALVRAGRISAIEARTNPARYVPSHWLGQHRQPMTDVQMRKPRLQGGDDMSSLLPLQAGDRILICSPEIGNALEDKDIKAALTGRTNGMAIQRLIRLAQKERGSLDEYVAGLWFYRPRPGQMARIMLSICLWFVLWAGAILLVLSVASFGFGSNCPSAYFSRDLLSAIQTQTNSCKSEQSEQANVALPAVVTQFCPVCQSAADKVGSFVYRAGELDKCYCEFLAPVTATVTITPMLTVTVTVTQLPSMLTSTVRPQPTGTKPAATRTPSPVPPLVRIQATPKPPATVTVTPTPRPPATASPTAAPTLTGTVTGTITTTSTTTGTNLTTTTATIDPATPLVIALLAPAADAAELRDTVTFAWRAVAPPPAGLGYQIIFWQAGKQPQNGFGIHKHTADQYFDQPISLPTLDDNLPDKFLLVPDKTYQWTVCLYDPVAQRITERCSSDQRTFIYKRG